MRPLETLLPSLDSWAFVPDIEFVSAYCSCKSVFDVGGQESRGSCCSIWMGFLCDGRRSLDARLSVSWAVERICRAYSSGAAEFCFIVKSRLGEVCNTCFPLGIFCQYGESHRPSRDYNRLQGIFIALSHDFKLVPTRVKTARSLGSYPPPKYLNAPRVSHWAQRNLDIK